jgi:uncharacterized protein (DUF58 family)
VTGGGGARPARPFGGIPGSFALIGGWWLVAHSSGQGWVQALGDMVAAGLLVGLVGPWIAVRRLRAEIVAAPTDAVAGQPVEVKLRRSAPTRLTGLHPAGAPTTAASMRVTPAGRGVLGSVTVELATAAPFGLQWWRRRVDLPLPAPLYVAPRPVPAAAPGAPPPEERTGVEGRSSRSGMGADLRAARPYRPGDSRRLVHWPASAHTGELMVRELERPSGPPVELVVALPTDPAAAEAEAGRALGAVFALLDAGVPVILTTTEADGRRTAPVRDRRDGARRLAAAI